MIVLLVSLALGLGLPVHGAVGQGTCEFKLGFKGLQALIPEVVGECIDDEHHDPDNGDGLQQTTNGLLVWRQADNWTAFTDGSTSWINGPSGLQSRPNGERFPWESSLPDAAGGIEGRVTLGPTCPGPQRMGQVCERPYEATISIRDRSGKPVASVRADARGHFRAVLAPGTYTLHPEPPATGALPRAKDQPVTVTAGRFTPVTIRYDTGTR